MKSKKLLLIPLLGLLLVGCNPSVSESLSSSTPPASDPTSDDPSSDIISEGSVPVSSETPSSTPAPSSDVPVEERNNYHLVDPGDNYSNRALDEAMDMTALSSLGDQKILVVPIAFTDTVNTLATPENHEMIRKSFFGAAAETGWESVASYYDKASFGKVSITGEVLPYFVSQYSTSEFADLPNDIQDQQMGEGYYWDQTHHMIEDIYNTLDAELLKEYDVDGDGHVDALWMVYVSPIYPFKNNPDVDDPFWAYKFYWNRYPNVNKPTPNVYAWASYEFAFKATGYGVDKPDAHTYIHESGHVFGLADYYDYDGKSAPTAQIDMMDHNVTDHNAYSKYLLNWTSPYYVTGHADITLRPAEQTGDFILLKDGWNGHAYDEYLLLEYYTPTGLNEKDSVGGGYQGYQAQVPLKGITVPGVRIWHVDSRLIKFEYKNTPGTDSWVLDKVGWSDEIVGNDATYTTIGPSNTASRSRNGTGNTDGSLKLLHLLDAEGKTGKVGNWLQSANAQATDAKGVFKEGQKVAADDWGRFLQTAPVNGVRPATFNDGTQVGYSLEIGEMTAEGVVIKLRKA